jgi:hypothetical protein
MHRFLQRSLWLASALVIAIALLQTEALACPTCKESLAQSDPARANMVRGYFWSIIFMMSMPYLILAGLGAMFWWQVRKAKLEKLRAVQSVAGPPRKQGEPVEV